MRIIFMGTPDFAVPCLKELINSDNKVVGVFTQPDKPKGRGYELTPPPVKVCALEHDIPVFQPRSMRDGEALNIINSLDADLIIVIAFGKILPKEILESVKHGCINIHASLLPKLRGAAPIQWSILNGEKETGITSMQMDEGLDTGDMLIQKTFSISENMTGGELFNALSELGTKVLIETIQAVKENRLNPKKQDDSLSSYAPMLSKTLCPIDFNKTAQEVHNHIRGLNPWPVAMTLFEGKRLKIHKSILTDEMYTGTAGKTIVKNGRLLVACGDGRCIEILELQAEGKKRMDAESYMRGHKISSDAIMGA